MRYEPLEKLSVPRPVDRIEYVVRACTGRRVLDLGAMDETAFTAKQGTGTWLHERIGRVAEQVLGVDSSEHVPAAGFRTGPNSKIVRGDVMRLDEVLDRQPFQPQVIVGGELIEHVPDPLGFLGRLSQLSLPEFRCILTTPNATALHNVLVGLTNRESTHPDHLFILSYKTLNTLCLRAGFADWQIQPYFARFTEMKSRVGPRSRSLVLACEVAVNAAEWLFPMLSFGLILDATVRTHPPAG